jgi:hypothetical protein
MILAVGPGTPASVCWRAEGEEEEEEEEEDFAPMIDSDDEDYWQGQLRAMETDHEDDSNFSEAASEHQGNSSSSEENRSDDSAQHVHRVEQRARQDFRADLNLFRVSYRRMVRAIADDSDESSNEEIHIRGPQHRRQHQSQRRPWLPSIRHGGCINTVST